MEGRILNNKLEKMCKEVDVAWFQVISLNLLT
jgi:hypothetical protein